MENTQYMWERLRAIQEKNRAINWKLYEECDQDFQNYTCRIVRQYLCDMHETLEQKMFIKVFGNTEKMFLDFQGDPDGGKKKNLMVDLSSSFQ